MTQDSITTVYTSNEDQQEGFIGGQPSIMAVFERHYQAEKDLLATLSEERRKEIIKELGYGVEFDE